MAGLIDGQFSAVREADRGQQHPALIGHAARHLDSFVPQFGEGGVDVVTHQVKLMAALTVGRMNSKLGGGQGEDEPAAAGVGRRQVQHVGEERTDLLGGRGEHDRMNASNHAAILANDRAGDGGLLSLKLG